MRVLWLTNIPSPYRVAFFNELGKLCSLTVLFERRSADDRDDSWKDFRAEHFTPVFLGGIKHGIAESFCPGVVGYLSQEKYDRIVVTNYANPTGILAVAFMKLRGIPYIVEGDGAFAGNGVGFKEKLKTWLLSTASLCFSTANAHDDYYHTYGVPQERIVRYPFTSLYARDILSSPVPEETKAALRKKLGMTEDRTLLAVGQFIPRKGYDILIEAMADLPQSVGCYIVGGQAPDSYTAQVAAMGLKNVHFVDFMDKAALAEYYMAADIFVHPTREDIWGLVINEAMAKGLPVVTTERCVAGLELISDRALGSIIPAENPQALSHEIKRLLDADTVSSQAVLDAIAPYTFEEMARCHMDILELR